ncbi:CPBP family intramembrane glutamic endopeptidase [Dactylosporangium sp. NPDC005555]|uniref:CPBP family intramembrane glutamic endopeptidase n=1 Tax=Dactylosporangium sp. NPDC005555 TaxID=3154889 RepID=UPI0033B131CB
MTRDAAVFAAIATAATAVWLALYRLPLRRPRTRQRVRLAVATRTGLPGRYVFPILGTLIYLAGGVLASIAVMYAGDVSLAGLLAWRVTPHGIGLLLLTAVGASALTAFAMSTLYALRPRIDVPGAVTTVRWITEILALPRLWRYAVPATSAVVEEFFFRGAFLGGLLATGTPVWAAIAISGAVFTLGQVLLTETALQATVLALSSVVLAVVCGLLVVVQGSVLPAIVVHASFAAYYTQTSARRAAPVAAAVPR